jgi:hypothetical protein
MSLAGYPRGGAISKIPRGMRALMGAVIGVSIPEGIALLFGPASWYEIIWGWSLTPMTARFIAGLYLTVALGFIMTWRDNTWERGRIPLAMLWVFALIALVSAAFLLATGNGGTAGPIIVLDRPFTWIWFLLYIVSAAGGAYYHLVHPRLALRRPVPPTK